ncbi:molybdopterin molybdotransferase MoeA [Natranaerobius thermophilus]|uniref:Molybdopterin molybdenumtransferase n=1 Tax=Natranaerobius thermophilus (strain ATCC BAA-1301 / DSM 18059 / JW/NM-WN-LF) TaxID=457570 RepID=B2A6W0_NATTJ|nr:molybdopterin molybdotransferase MoeA [Natranaerobius thermophilus]ACB84241.1 molybdenum cofactor synthesis domain protein [Natranaerobius thermophilus JW/NM-WN-LF]
MISPEEACQKIYNLMPDRNIESVSLLSCVESCISENIIAQEDVPSFCRSPYDGYAFNSEATRNVTSTNPVEIDIIDTVPAGKNFEYFNNLEDADLNSPSKPKLNDRKKQDWKQTGMKVMTGGMIPDIYDAVLPWEQVGIKDKEQKILINKEIPSQHNIIPKGEDIKKGELVIKEGEKLTPYHIGVLASLGFTHPRVYAPYKIGILVTGTELVNPENDISPGKIRSSNNFSLGATLQCMGHEVLDFGIVGDSKKKLAEKIEEAVSKVDILLTTGGVSRGDYDFVPYVLEEMKAKRLFWRVKMKPGTPLHVSQYQGTPVISLSGNPAASMASFHLLLAPALQNNGKRQTATSLKERSHASFLAKDIKKKTSSLWRFVRGKAWIGNDGVFYSTPIAKEKPNMLKTMIWANGYIVVPPDSQAIRAGDKVNFIPIDK